MRPYFNSYGPNNRNIKNMPVPGITAPFFHTPVQAPTPVAPTVVPTPAPAPLPATQPAAVPPVMPPVAAPEMPQAVPNIAPPEIPQVIPQQQPAQFTPVCPMMPPCMSGMMPGMFSGAMSGTMPGMMPGMMSGTMPGMMPDMMSGMMSGTMPSMTPGMISGTMPGMMPEMYSMEGSPASTTSDPPPVLSNNPAVSNIVLFKELTGFPNYGNPSGNADILYTGNRGIWTFDIPTFLLVPGNLRAQLVIRAALDDHYNAPAGRYTARITINGTVVHNGPVPLEHGTPAGGRFVNWRSLTFDIRNFRRNNRIEIVNTSNIGSNEWIGFDWMEIRLVTR